MPWRKTDVSKERVKFVLEWERRWNAAEGASVDFSELCRVFGISRTQGYYWVNRYRDGGFKLSAIEEERSRRPHTSPTAVPEELQDFVVAARKAHPRWGPRKLHAWLTGRHPELALPAPSTIGEILRRRGLVEARRRRRRRAPPLSQPFAEATGPNAVWCVDFKGKFRTGDGEWCHVLTLLDAYSRYLLRCEAVLDPDGDAVEAIFDSAFREFGLPGALRSDNGPPFASTGAGGLTWLSVWWLKLGIRLERIEPGKPQQNGRQERVHLTLEEVVAPPRAHIAAQQRALDLWRREYNEERPHEALGQKPPVRFYTRSSRHYPRALLSPHDGLGLGEHPVDRQGFIHWRKRKLFVSTALEKEVVAVVPDDIEHRGRWAVVFGPIVLGWFYEHRPTRGLILPRRRRRRKKPDEGTARDVLGLTARDLSGLLR
jgi:transposase InsO family protein